VQFRGFIAPQENACFFCIAGLIANAGFALDDFIRVVRKFVRSGALGREDFVFFEMPHGVLKLFLTDVFDRVRVSIDEEVFGAALDSAALLARAQFRWDCVFFVALWAAVHVPCLALRVLNSFCRVRNFY